MGKRIDPDVRQIRAAYTAFCRMSDWNARWAALHWLWARLVDDEQKDQAKVQAAHGPKKVLASEDI